MELDTIWRIIDEGSTPVIVVIAILLYRLDKSIGEFLAAVKARDEAGAAHQKARDEKLDTIHNDIGSMIRRIAGMNGGPQ